MKRIIAFIAVFALSCVLLKGCSNQTPDAIYVNGVVMTVDPDQPYAEAFAVANGRFIAVGTNDEIRRLARRSTKVVDLNGMTVTPGFNDTHLHPLAVWTKESPHYVPWLGPESVQTMDELVATLKAVADRRAPGMMVRGVRYQDPIIGRHPTRHDLDKASTQHPIRITHSSGHVTVVNSYVLEASGITRNTPNPAGGSFDRDRDGTPNGIVRGAATRMLKTFEEARPTFDERVEAFMLCFENYARVGITSVGIAGGGFDELAMYEAMRDAGTPVRMNFMVSEANLPLLAERGIYPGWGDDRLKIISIKLFHGNSFSGRTAWVSQHYYGQPGYYGIPPARSQAELDDIIQQIHDAGFQAVVHSNGDREIDMTLTAIERAQANNPRPDARHRIEHASVMTLPLLERAKKAGVIYVFHSYIWEHGRLFLAFGPEARINMIHPYRTALDMGVLVASHSDATVATAHPVLRIQSMVTRQSHCGLVIGANQRVSVEEAIKVWTQDGAFVTFEENIKGSITPGKLADFVVLREDPRKVDPLQIRNIVVDQTYIGGNLVFQAP